MNPALQPGAATARPTRKDYITAFGEAVARFTSDSGDKILSQVPALLVSDFGVARSELWLWDESSRSCYITHIAGIEAERKRTFAAQGEGLIGKVAKERQPRENLQLYTLGDEDQKIAARTNLSHVSAYPLIAKGHLIGVLANYHNQAAESELLTWWQMYAEICSVAAQEVLTEAESQKRISQLSLLFEATRLLNSTLDLSELLELILKIARTELKADRGSVFLLDKKSHELWSIVASGLDHEEIRVPVGKGIAGKVAETGEVINVADAYTLPYFDSSYDKKFGYTTRSLLSLPIRHHDGQIVGVIQLLNKSGSSTFGDEDVDFLNKLSGHMAMALENARLHREIVEKQRLEKEMALARDIQRSLLPASPPVVPGYELAVLNQPCPEVGGNYYDFLNLGPQSLLLVMADVEGKGVSSALLMSNLQATLRALIMHLHSLEVLALSLNEMIYNDARSEKTLGIFLGLVDTRRGNLQYINAGHAPPILINGEAGAHRLLREGGAGMGASARAEYQRGSAHLQSGDILLCYSDGIPRTTNAQQEEYGPQRLAECAARLQTRSAQAIAHAALAEINQFSRGHAHPHDKVLMVMKVTKI